MRLVAQTPPVAYAGAVSAGGAATAADGAVDRDDEAAAAAAAPAMLTAWGAMVARLWWAGAYCPKVCFV